MHKKIVNFQDPHGLIQAEINAYLQAVRKKYPYQTYTTSSVIREAIGFGLPILRQKLQKKLPTQKSQ